MLDFSGDEPEELGCVECDWDQLVGDDRCVHSTAFYGRIDGRCTRPTVVNGMCWQHADKTNLWHQTYAWLRNGAHDATADLPEVYREAFVRALLDARLLQHDEHETSRVTELADRAAKLREAKAESTSVVYFIRREGLIKIGTTTKLGQRIKAISKGSSMPDGMTVGPVELLAATPGDRALEGRLHRQFDADRVDNTEWFRPSTGLLRLIARYRRRADPAAVAA